MMAMSIMKLMSTNFFVIFVGSAATVPICSLVYSTSFTFFLAHVGSYCLQVLHVFE